MIYSLTRRIGYCYASNKHLARELNVKIRTINYSLSKLKTNNYITIEYNYSSSSCKRKIFIKSLKSMQKVAEVNEKTSSKHYEGNCIYNNKYKNRKVKVPKPQFSYDLDGVMLWNNKRCEMEELTPEEEKTMNQMLEKYEE